MSYSVALSRATPTTRMLWAIHADKLPLLTWYLLIGLSIMMSGPVSAFSNNPKNPVVVLTDIMLFWSGLCGLGWPLLVVPPLISFFRWKRAVMSERTAARWASGWRVLHLHSLCLLGMLGTVIAFGVVHHGPYFFSLTEHGIPALSALDLIAGCIEYAGLYWSHFLHP